MVTVKHLQYGVYVVQETVDGLRSWYGIVGKHSAFQIQGHTHCDLDVMSAKSG